MGPQFGRGTTAGPGGGRDNGGSPQVCSHHARGEGCGGEKDAALRPSGRSLGPGRGGAGRVGVAVRLCGPTMVPDLGDTWGASSLRAGGPACFSPLSRNDRMPLGCPAVPGAEFSVAGFASGAFAMQPRNGRWPVWSQGRWPFWFRESCSRALLVQNRQGGL